MRKGLWHRCRTAGQHRLSEMNTAKTIKPGRDCRGSSLIEVIVAMLILAIIIVPALDMFANASRINGLARGRQYANAALENVLEELRAGNYIFTYDVADAAAEDTYDIGRRLRLCSAYSNDGVLTGTGFTTGVMQQGNREYQARIRFDADEYRGGSGLNDYAMPDINSYDSTNSEMLLLDGGSDQIIVEEFYRQYLAQEQAEYQERLNEAWMESEAYLFRYEFDKWYEKWQATHDDEPPEDYEPAAFDASTVPPSNPVELDEFRQYIKKRTEIKIEHADAEDYAVSYTVRYYTDAAPAALRLEEAFSESYEYEAGSGSRFTADKLNYIYVFYQPFTQLRNQEELIISAQEISQEADWSCRMYLAIQGGDNGQALKVTVNMDSSLSPDEKEERLEFLTAGALDSNYSYTGMLVPSLEPVDTVYTVSVEIVEVGKNEVIAQADTTLYYE